MTDMDLHRLIDELVLGTPPIVGQVRVVTALKIAINAGGPEVEEAVKEHCKNVIKNLIELGIRQP